MATGSDVKGFTRIVWLELLFATSDCITPRTLFAGFFTGPLPTNVLGWWLTLRRPTQSKRPSEAGPWPDVLASSTVQAFVLAMIEAHPKTQWEAILLSDTLIDPLSVFAIAAHEITHAVNRDLSGPVNALEDVADVGQAKVVGHLLGRDLARLARCVGSGSGVNPSLTDEAWEWLDATLDAQDIPTRVLRNKVQEYRAAHAEKQLGEISAALGAMRARHGGEAIPLVAFAPLPGFDTLVSGDLSDEMSPDNADRPLIGRATSETGSGAFSKQSCHDSGVGAIDR